MDLGTTISRTPVTIRMAWIVASLLFVFGSWLIGQGAWIHVKALAAQWLLQYAWQETLTTQRPVKPWPWADTWPVGRLIVPRLSINQIILANASGQSLAFGPGKVGNKKFSDDDSQGLLLSGHRDTHFSFLREIQQGDTVTLQMVQGDWLKYVVEETTVLDSRTDQLLSFSEVATLRLITCYPFDALLPGGPFRYVVAAKAVASIGIPQTTTSAMPNAEFTESGFIESAVLRLLTLFIH
ncbi:MAG: class GN sortase [Nitrospirales bacterium]|nr:MAG: class GN sortase [Nitrospirales bacterium]